MENVFTRFVGRTIVTDGSFVYNCGYEDVLRDGKVERVISDTALLGTVGCQKTVIVPQKFNGRSVKLIGRLCVYEKGPDFPDQIEKWVCLPTVCSPCSWDMIKRYYPDDRAIRMKPLASPEELVLGKCRIREAAFVKSPLRKVVFSASPKKIQNDTFRDCRNLEQVELAFGLERIGSYAFAGCEKLRHLILPGTVNHIQEGAFWGSGLETVVLSSVMTQLGDKVFGNCLNLQTVVIPPSIQQIAKTAFKDSPKVQIVGFKRSFAESYARNKGIPFISLEEMLNPLADGALFPHG